MKRHFIKISLVGALVSFALLSFISNSDKASTQLSDTKRTAYHGAPPGAAETPIGLDGRETGKLVINNKSTLTGKGIEEQPANEEITSGTNDDFGGDTQNVKDPIKLAIEDTYNNGTFSIDGVDGDLVGSGRMFAASIDNIKSASVGTEIKIDLFGDELEGLVTKNVTTKSRGNTYVKIDLGAGGRYMSVYYGSNLTKGKVYTERDSYIFQHNGEVGFILPIYEYKKLKNALVYD